MRRRFVASMFALLCFVAWPAGAQINGTLGIFFDPYGRECAGSLNPGAARTLYVLLLPEGDTRGGITGAEFRIDARAASGYTFSGERVLLPPEWWLGDKAVGGSGMNVFSDECHNRNPLPILSFQVQNTGGVRDGVLQIAAREPPSNERNFPCALVTLCNAPVFTAVCIEPGLAVLNPSGAIRCGSSAEASEWGRVKELYR